jgi:hypothetical protein
MIFTDAQGRQYEVIDYRVVDRKKKRVPFQDLRSEGRAFVPVGWEGEILIRQFGRIAYRATNPKLLAQDFAQAKPATVPAAQRDWGG